MERRRPPKYKHNPTTPFHTCELDGPVAYLYCIGVHGPLADKIVKFILDSEDAEKLAAAGFVGIARWSVQKTTHQHDPNYGRYYCHIRIPKNGQSKPLHRVVMNCPPSKVVDHISGITEDNRKENLRITTTGKNVTNRTRIGRNNTSGVHGVQKLTYKTLPTMYQAFISIDKVQHRLPPTPDLEEAARQRRELELKYYGEFAPKKQLRRDDV